MSGDRERGVDVSRRRAQAWSDHDGGIDRGCGAGGLRKSAGMRRVQRQLWRKMMSLKGTGKEAKEQQEHAQQQGEIIRNRGAKNRPNRRASQSQKVAEQKRGEVKQSMFRGSKARQLQCETCMKNNMVLAN